jgi:hypothetical protein
MTIKHDFIKDAIQKSHPKSDKRNLPMPRLGNSLANASRYLGWEAAYTRGLMAEAVLAENRYLF